MAGILKQKPSEPIRVGQFFQSFYNAWNSNPQFMRSRLLPRRIGIAVSGGADSMALAGLCRQLQLARPKLELFLQAFIIDHKARKESSEEALKVAEWLSSIGVESQILPLKWSSEKDVADVTAFETSARQKRYQALGEACRVNRLATLLTGHHSDDNVETAILRLCQRAGRQGLAGIAPLSRIPECHGIWGISDSGYFKNLEGYQRRVNTKKGSRFKFPARSTSFNMAEGGVYLCRPLLPFTKSSILETCDEMGIPFVNDPTNFDPTLTVRNTIRSLLTANKLPRALQAPAMGDFILRNRESFEDVMRQTDSLLRECRLIEFIAESSTMKIQFPVLDKSHPLRSPDNDSRLLAAALRRITELVSPLDQKSLALQKYTGFAERIFSGWQNENFSVGGAYYRLSIKDRPESNTWHVSRTPFRAHAAPEINISNLNEEFSTPVLWDFRYWLQFRLPPNTKRDGDSLAPIVVRGLRPEDMTPIAQILEKYGNSKDIFSSTAPFKSRFTLPVVTTKYTASDGSTEERYLALPTFGLDLSRDTGFSVQWRWLYRKIDDKALILMGWLKRNVSNPMEFEQILGF